MREKYIIDKKKYPDKFPVSVIYFKTCEYSLQYILLIIHNSKHNNNPPISVIYLNRANTLPIKIQTLYIRIVKDLKIG